MAGPIPRSKTTLVDTLTAQATTKNSAAVEVENASVLGIVVDITASTGTGENLVVGVEWSDDGTNFGEADPTADAFTAITGPIVLARQVAVKGPFFRVVSTITGTTPTFTGTITAKEG
jgi:hypothetical protein